MMKPGTMTGKIFCLESELPEFEAKARQMGQQLRTHGPGIHAQTKAVLGSFNSNSRRSASSMPSSFAANMKRIDEILDEIRARRITGGVRGAWSEVKEDVQRLRRIIRLAALQEKMR